MTSVLNCVFGYAKALDIIDYSIGDIIKDAAYINNGFREDKKSDEEMVFNEHETELLANYFLTNRTMYNLGLLLCIVTGIRDGELSSLLRGECTSEYLDIHQTETSYKDANTGNNIPLLCKKA